MPLRNRMKIHEIKFMKSCMKYIFQKKSLIIFSAYLQFSIFLSLLPIFWMEYSCEVFQVILVLVFIECMFVSFVDKPFNIYQIFLFAMFLFSVALPIFELLGLYSYPTGNKIMLGDGMGTIVSDKTLSETYKVLISMLFGTSFGWLIGILNFNKHKARPEFLFSNVIRSIKYRNSIKMFFIVLLPIVVYYNSIRVYYSTIFGYVEVMHRHSVNLNIYKIFIVADILYKMSGYAILYQSRNHKEYIKNAILFMIPFFIQIFTGARGETIAVLITIVFIYSQLFKQLKFRKIIFIGIFMFIFAYVIGAYRFTGISSSVLFDLSKSKLILSSIVLSIISNAKSLGVIAYTIELKEQFFNKIPFLFGYIHGIFSFAPNYTYEGIQNKNYLAQHITYLINPNKLFRGSTIGTSMGAEFYEFSNGSIVIIFILSIILLYCACYLISRLNKNHIMFYLGAIYIEVLFMSPRGSIMKIFSKETIFSMAILILILKLPRLQFFQQKKQAIYMKNNF